MLRATDLNAVLRWSLAFAFALACASVQADAQIIRTYAGGGVGDGGAATGAMLSVPEGVAVDTSGNLYIADRNNSRVRKVSPGGVITTVAGNGIYGYSGDGGAATSATINSPKSVAIDALGNLYITDSGNSRIRRVSAAGIITTVAGNGTAGYSGDGGAATNAAINNPFGIVVDLAGNLYFADAFNNCIRKVATNGIITTLAGNGSPGYAGDGGAATSALLWRPAGIAFDASSGNLYVADGSNSRIRKVTVSGIITTVAGNGTDGYSGDGGAATSAELAGPFDVAVDTSGNLFIADTGNNLIRKVSTSGIITTVAGLGYGYGGFSGDGGAATSARLNYPTSIVIDGSGNLYLADVFNNRIRQVAANGIINTVAGTSVGRYGYSSNSGNATSAVLDLPAGVATDITGNVYIADTVDNVVRKVSVNGIITTIAGNGLQGYSDDGGSATTGSLNQPVGVVLDAPGDLYIADSLNNRIRKVSTSGIITTVAGNGTPGYSGDGGPATSTELYNPSGIAIDASGNLYIADASNLRIRKVAASGIITTVAGNGTSGYTGDGGLATNAQFKSVDAVAVDTLGNLYIADTNNHCVRKVAPNGIVSTVAGGGSIYPDDGLPATSVALNSPNGVAVDASNNLYIADRLSNRIYKVTTNGIITTVAGNGTQGNSGDGGPATSAQLLLPRNVAVSAFGNLYIADTSNNRIREVLGDNIFKNGFE